MWFKLLFLLVTVYPQSFFLLHLRKLQTYYLAYYSMSRSDCIRNCIRERVKYIIPTFYFNNLRLTTCICMFFRVYKNSACWTLNFCKVLVSSCTLSVTLRLSRVSGAGFIQLSKHAVCSLGSLKSHWAQATLVIYYAYFWASPLPKHEAWSD